MALYSLANQAGAAFRAALNTVLGKVHRNYYGSTDPASSSESTPGMIWVDTNGANPEIKMRNPSDTAWISLGTLNTSFEVAGTTAFTRTLLDDADSAAARATLQLASFASQEVDIQEFTTPGSATWTKPSWAGASDFVLVYLVGAGGGGEKVSGGVGPAKGGGGGAGLIRTFKAGDLAATVPMVIGAGGAGKSATAAGDTGGATQFSSSVNTVFPYCSASGGIGGAAGSIAYEDYPAAQNNGGSANYRNSNDAVRGWPDHAVFRGGDGGDSGSYKVGMDSMYGGGGGGSIESGTSLGYGGGGSAYAGSGGSSISGSDNPAKHGEYPGGGGGGSAATHASGDGADGYALVITATVPIFI